MSFVFKHPSYYKKIRDANKDQAISNSSATAPAQRAPGPGLKPQATSYKLPGPRPISEQNKGLFHRRQAASSKLRKK